MVLNNHMTNDGWCCNNMTDGSGLWFNEDFEHGGEEKWLRMLAEITERYAANPRVIGMDLRNEVRPDASRECAYDVDEQEFVSTTD